MRQNVAISKIPGQAGEQRSAIVAFNFYARVFHQLAVLDAGRARGLTRAAVQAFVDVLYEAGIDGHFALFDANHLIDPAAWRISFEMPQPEGRTMIQAQAEVT